MESLHFREPSRLQRALAGARTVLRSMGEGFAAANEVRESGYAQPTDQSPTGLDLELATTPLAIGDGIVVFPELIMPADGPASTEGLE